MEPSGFVWTVVPGGNTFPPRDIEPSGLCVTLVPSGSVVPAKPPGVFVSEIMFKQTAKLSTDFWRSWNIQY